MHTKIKRNDTCAYLPASRSLREVAEITEGRIRPTPVFDTEYMGIACLPVTTTHSVPESLQGKIFKMLLHCVNLEKPAKSKYLKARTGLPEY